MKTINKTITVTISLALLILTPLTIKRLKKEQQPNEITIGIIQTASHPALDAVKNGFVSNLKNLLGNRVAFVIHNAQGSVAQAHTITQHFHDDTTVTAIFAIGTLAAQTAAQNEKLRPIIIAAVTDPHAAHLNQPNVCGLTDMIDVQQEIVLLQALVPHVQTVALLFNQGEINAQTMIKKMHKELQARGLHTLNIPVTQESEIPLAIDKAISSADVILTPIDNTVASTISLIAHKARIAKKPLFVSDNMLVPKGALAACGVDYSNSGNQAAQAMVNILINKKKPSEIGFSDAKIEQFVLNKTLIEELDITVPDSIRKQSNLVELSC